MSDYLSYQKLSSVEMEIFADLLAMNIHQGALIVRESTGRGFLRIQKVLGEISEKESAVIPPAVVSSSILEESRVGTFTYGQWLGKVQEIINNNRDKKILFLVNGNQGSGKTRFVRNELMGKLSTMQASLLEEDAYQLSFLDHQEERNLKKVEGLLNEKLAQFSIVIYDGINSFKIYRKIADQLNIHKNNQPNLVVNLSADKPDPGRLPDVEISYLTVKSSSSIMPVATRKQKKQFREFLREFKALGGTTVAGPTGFFAFLKGKWDCSNSELAKILGYANEKTIINLLSLKPDVSGRINPQKIKAIIDYFRLNLLERGKGKKMMIVPFRISDIEVNKKKKPSFPEDAQYFLSIAQETGAEKVLSADIFSKAVSVNQFDRLEKQKVFKKFLAKYMKTENFSIVGSKGLVAFIKKENRWSYIETGRFLGMHPTKVFDIINGFKISDQAKGSFFVREATVNTIVEEFQLNEKGQEKIREDLFLMAKKMITRDYFLKLFDKFFAQGGQDFSGVKGFVSFVYQDGYSKNFIYPLFGIEKGDVNKYLFAKREITAPMFRKLSVRFSLDEERQKRLWASGGRTDPMPKIFVLSDKGQGENENSRLALDKDSRSDMPQVKDVIDKENSDKSIIVDAAKQALVANSNMSDASRGQVNLQAFMYGKVPMTNTYNFLNTIYSLDPGKKVRVLDFGSNGQFVQKLFDQRYKSVLENVYALDIEKLRKMDFNKAEKIGETDVFAMQEMDSGYAPDIVDKYAKDMKVDWIFMNAPDPGGRMEYYFKEIEALSARNAMVFLRLHEIDQGTFEKFRTGFRDIGFDFMGVIEQPPSDYPATDFISADYKNRMIYLFTNQPLEDYIDEEKDQLGDGRPQERAGSSAIVADAEVRNRLSQMILKYYQGSDQDVESRMEWFLPYINLGDDLLEQIVREGLTKIPFTNPSNNFMLNDLEVKALWSSAEMLARDNVQDVVITTYGGGEFLPKGSLLHGGNTELEE
ncbi:MAG: hypothetical protein WC900_09480, partial [Oscillospiraceae bacterium]